MLNGGLSLSGELWKGRHAMTDERPQNWDWVHAIGTCSPQVMFGQLKELARQNVTKRNEQLGRGVVYALREIDGVSFSVGKTDAHGNAMFFGLTDDLKAMEVSKINRQNAVRYAVKLCDDGLCRWASGNVPLDHWQVLRTALEPLLFS
jgi:hypothetical protein